MTRGLASYRNNAVLSASPQQLLLMLYDRLLVDLTAAHAALTAEDDATATYRIGHANEIIAALVGSLRRDVWDGADGLFGLYMYVSGTLIRVTIFRDAALLQECIELMEPLRRAWHAAADQLAAASSSWETGDTADNGGVFAIA